jgi:hypothetical protein
MFEEDLAQERLRGLAEPLLEERIRTITLINDLRDAIGALESKLGQLDVALAALDPTENTLALISELDEADGAREPDQAFDRLLGAVRDYGEIHPEEVRFTAYSLEHALRRGGTPTSPRILKEVIALLLESGEVRHGGAYKGGQAYEWVR